MFFKMFGEVWGKKFFLTFFDVMEVRLVVESGGGGEICSWYSMVLCVCV